MATFKLHTPHSRGDDTITEYEANDIVHIKSVVGDDDAQGTHFYLRDVPGQRQFCLESAKEVKQMVAAHKDVPQKPGHVINIETNYGQVQVDSPHARQEMNVTINQQFNESMRNLLAAVATSDLDAHDKDEIGHTLDRVKHLAAGEQTEKSKSSVLDKLKVVEKMVSVSEKLSKIAMPLILIVRAHFGL